MYVCVYIYTYINKYIQKQLCYSNDKSECKLLLTPICKSITIFFISDF